MAADGLALKILTFNYMKIMSMMQFVHGQFNFFLILHDIHYLSTISYVCSIRMQHLYTYYNIFIIPHFKNLTRFAIHKFFHSTIKLFITTNGKYFYDYCCCKFCCC